MDRCIHGLPRRVGTRIRKIHADLDFGIYLHEAANSRAEPRNAERNVAADSERTRAAAQPEPAHTAKNKVQTFAYPLGELDRSDGRYQRSGGSLEQLKSELVLER